MTTHHGSTWQPATRSTCSVPLPPPHWGGEENGQRVKLVGGDKDGLIRQQRKE